MSSPPNDTRIAHGNVRSMRVLLALLVATLFTGAVLVNSFLHRQRDTQMCEMSYSRPLFVPLTPGPNSRLRNKYTLYLYREGLIDDVQKLRGTPALFIPGHAGSYRQARSIAAEAAYYHQNHPQSARFDFFTVDLNEEFSALSGQLLLDQAEFLNDAVAFIQQMYPHPAPILIVGHSMGGVVARLLFALPNYRPGSIDTVLTLATPHAVAPILVDPKLFRVYDTISRYGYEQRKSLENVTLVSLAGGTLDSIVNSDAASISQLFPRSHSLTAFSTAIPNVWTGCDHMAILWCNQLVKVVAASLSESLRKDYRSSVDARMKVFKSYFLSRPLLSGWPELNYPLNVTTINHSDVKSLSLHWPKQSETVIHILPTRIDDVDTIKILTNVDVSKSDKVSVLLCQQTSKCIDASTAAIQLPATMPAQHKVSFIELDQRSLDAYDIVGILQKPDPNSGFLLLERSLRSQIEVTKSLLEIAMTGVSLNLSSTMHTHISIPCMYHPILALRVHISMPTIPKFKPILQQTLGDQGESKYFVVTGNSTLDVNFHADPTPDPSKYLHLHFWKQDPIQIHLSIDWYGSLGKSLLRCGPSMIIYTFVTSLTIMSYQVETFINSGISISFPVALIHCLKRRFPILIAIGSIAQLFATESGIFSKLALGYQGSLWWLFATFFCLSIGLLVLLWVVMTALLHMAKFVAVPMASSANIYILAATVIALVRVLPVPVIVVVLYVYWLGVTGLTLSQKQWKEYYNQQTILLLLTTLLPYNIPAVVIFIRDIVAVGWSGRVVTLSAVLDDIPMLAATFFCIMLGRRCYFPRWLPTMLHLTVLYYILFGVQVPFPIHALSTRL